MSELSKANTKQQLFLDALISEECMGDLRSAMRVAGYSETTKISHLAASLRHEIRLITETLLAMYAPKAAFALTNILDNPDQLNSRHIITAAKEVLDRTGLVAKTQVELDVNAHSAVVILPPKSPT